MPLGNCGWNFHRCEFGAQYVDSALLEQKLDQSEGAVGHGA